MLFDKCPEVDESKEFITSEVDCQYDDLQGKTKSCSHIFLKSFNSIENFKSGKILIYSGYPFENGNKAEVVDLMNPDADCDLYANVPVDVHSALGGKALDQHILCGGIDDQIEVHKDCYKIGEIKPFLELLQPRYDGDSVILSNSTIFISGEK